MRCATGAVSPLKGVISVSFAVSEKKHQIMAGPNVTARGLATADEEDLDLALDELERVAEAAFARLSHADRAEDETVETNVGRAVRKAAEKLWGKRPLVDVSVLRI